MPGRFWKIFFLCGAFALTGVALPMMLGDDPAQATTIRVLHGLGVLGFLGGLLLLFGITGDSAPVGDQVYSSPRPAPRTLDTDPLGAETLPLEQRIETAAEASQNYGRTIGLLAYNLDAYRHVARAAGAAAAEAMMNEAVVLVRGRLRNTDRVERLGKGRLLVCIVLLPEKAALDSIRTRLDPAIRELGRGAGVAEAAVDVGSSIYPIGGYSGEDLIATARTRCDAEHAARIRMESRQRKSASADAGVRSAAQG